MKEKEFIIECPYCDKHGAYKIGKTDNAVICKKCEKIFKLEIHYIGRKIRCYKKSNHDYKVTSFNWYKSLNKETMQAEYRFCKELKCSKCDRKRLISITEEEFIKHTDLVLENYNQIK